MKLKCDDVWQVYGYYNDEETERLSPFFDYMEDAIEWKRRKEMELIKANEVLKVYSEKEE